MRNKEAKEKKERDKENLTGATQKTAIIKERKERSGNYREREREGEELASETWRKIEGNKKKLEEICITMTQTKVRN